MKNYTARLERNKLLHYGRFLIAFFVLAFLTFHVPPVLAQEQSRTVTIVPPTVKQISDAGQKSEGIMKVINDSASAITFTVDTQDFIVTDTKGTPNLLPANSLAQKYSASAWIGVAPNTFTVKPHAEQILNYYIQIPKDARPGGHYAAVVFRPTTDGTDKGTGASIQSEIGTLFYITVNGTINEYAQVSKFSGNSFQETGPVKIETQIKNFSDIHISPSGYITITNMLGKNITQLPLDNYNIFPGVARDYENIFTSNRFLFGRYKATLLGSYGVNHNLPLTASFYFWVFPWKIAVIVILIIIALVLSLLVWKYKKRTSLLTSTPAAEEEKINKG